MEPSPRTLLLATELDALAAAAERVEAAEARLLLPDLARWPGAHDRAYRRAVTAYNAARNALDARARFLALDRKEGISVDPTTPWDAEDDDGDLVGQDKGATRRARLAAREKRLGSQAGDPGIADRFQNGRQPGKKRWTARPVMPVGEMDRRAMA